MTLTEEYFEFSDVVAQVNARQQAWISSAGDAVARSVYADADLLGTLAIDERNRNYLEVLDTLPAVTFRESQLWRYQLGHAAQRLADDTRRWGAPIPRCTGEEMMLHVILQRAMRMAKVRKNRTARWDDLFEYLFQDHDVLCLYDMPTSAVYAHLPGVANLETHQWFSEFGLPFPMPDRPARTE